MDRVATARQYPDDRRYRGCRDLLNQPSVFRRLTRVDRSTGAAIFPTALATELQSVAIMQNLK